MLAIEEIVSGLVVGGAENAAADFRQYTDGGVLIAEGEPFVFPFHAFIGQDVVDWVRVDMSGGTLIGSAGEEIRILFWVVNQVGRDFRGGFFHLNLSEGTRGEGQERQQNRDV